MQQLHTGQSVPLSQPPKVITTKDLSYLEDQLSWHLNIVKKCSHYAQESTDPMVQQLLNQAGEMHQRHYQTLLKHCQNNNTQMMTSVQQQMQQGSAQQAQQTN
ncbi:ferritin-like domain-containing protein [Bacillus horti]|uniref:Spore coat protein n=1 Tax=Caldalkalibacillus horti TaxID=77523 RepID=A0ABT9W4J3_9BACI|nr:ferritin-like domain-containing protein [Bacillus horti]MDQ0168162.1 hypothetical protein [Bacillus horti]